MEMFILNVNLYIKVPLDDDKKVYCFAFIYFPPKDHCIK
jgi:hypothetical protein